MVNCANDKVKYFKAEKTVGAALAMAGREGLAREVTPHVLRHNAESPIMPHRCAVC
jgi:hypothetical protein